MNTKLSYVLLTPARNEEACIGNLLDSITRQTVLPAKHIVISDGSTDATDQIVQRYARDCDVISLLRLDRVEARSAGSKVAALKAGYAQLKAIRAERQCQCTSRPAGNVASRGGRGC